MIFDELNFISRLLVFISCQIFTINVNFSCLITDVYTVLFHFWLTHTFQQLVRIEKTELDHNACEPRKKLVLTDQTILLRETSIECGMVCASFFLEFDRPWLGPNDLMALLEYCIFLGTIIHYWNYVMKIIKLLGGSKNESS